MAHGSAYGAYMRVDISGHHELIRKLNALGPRSYNVVRTASTRAMTPVAAALRKASPVGEEDTSGALKKSFGKKTKSFKKDWTVAVLVGPKRGFYVPDPRYKSGKKVPANYVHLVELGTKPHEQPNNPYYALTGHPGAVPMFFMRDTFRAMKPVVHSALVRDIASGIEREARKPA